MDLKLTINPKENTNMSSLVKQMCSLKCRITVNISDGVVSILDIPDSNVDTVIDAINEAFNITGMDITPTVTVPEPEEPAITADSIEFEKIEFSDKDVETQINKLLKNIYWAMYSSNAPSRDICQYIMSASVEIAMKYNPKPICDFSVGDIVDCNYGSHLSGEISGGHIHSIVCNIDPGGTVYVLPITKLYREGPQFMQFSSNMDVDYYNPHYTGGTILLKKGRYIRPERISEVIGHTHPDLFKKVLAELPNMVTFSCDDYEQKWAEHIGDIQSDDNMLPFTGKSETSTEVSINSDIENSEKTNKETDGSLLKGACDNSSNLSTNNFEDTPKLSAEDYLSSLISDSLKSLNKDISLEEQVKTFLSSIGFDLTQNVVEKSFIVACELKKITYTSIESALFNTYPDFNATNIKSILQSEFNKWTIKHSELKKKYPTISIITLIKVFAKNLI